MPKTLNHKQTFRFDEIAILVNDKIVDPSKANVDRYVGLEHLDSDSLKIRRWGAPTDVESSKLVFKSGDIIFGKRRVYQRKLAVADFDGICSAHAMVLRPKSDVVLPEFLPFFMQSDLFMERALEISVGSLSPTINWKTLAKEEFALPSLDEQRRIVEVLESLEKSKDNLTKSVDSSEHLRNALCVDLRWKNEDVGDNIPISTLLAVSRGGLWGSDKDEAEHNVIVLRSTEIDGQGIIDMDGGVIRSIPSSNISGLELKINDILLEKSGGGPNQPVGRVGFVEAVPDRDCSFICGNFIQLLRPNSKKVNADWLFWLLYGLHASKWTLRHQTQTTGIRNLQTKDYLSEIISVPTVDVQAIQVLEIRTVELARRELLKRINQLNILKRSIMYRTFNK